MGGGPDKSSLSFASTYVLGGSAAETATYPFDITKTRLQVAGEAGTAAGTGARRGLVGTMVGIIREEGPRQRYVAPLACLPHCVYSGIRVSAYEMLRESVFRKNWTGLSRCGRALAGMMRAIGQFVATPTDLVKVQMQIEGKRIARGSAAIPGR